MLGALGLWLVPLAASLPDAMQAANQTGGIPWWVWIIIILLLILLLWWLLSGRSGREAAPEERTPPAAAPPEPRAAAVEAPAAEMATPPPDDLRRIEGIGPKINGLLQEAGVHTFAQLAEANVDRLKHILSEADLRALADPTTWPEQAALAANADWEALQVLQDDLKGGRRE